jgi:hypothetical protein
MVSPAQTLSDCARATSAAESRFRIRRPIAPARCARIIALDDAAAGVLSRIADRPWASARFYLCEAAEDPAVLSAARAAAADLPGLPDLPEAQRDTALREIGGPAFPLSGELTGTDVVVVVATGSAGRHHAAAIGRICAARSIMTAGVVLAAPGGPDDAVAALRPYARVLLPTADEGDLVELLAALRV